MALINTNEHRNLNRYSVDLPLDLVLENGHILPVTADNISETGLQFSCDNWTANEIEPRGIHNHPLGNIRLKLVASVNASKKIYAKCRVIAARRLSRENYLIGLEFIDFEGSGGSQLNKFLNKL